ncbi:response regulator [Paraburkholderia sp. GAS333]|uniref:response regulator n=1 Tax=Paraburkholderia sp. GAS333 TaxID=3156279 RepID=UPI003D21FDDF
MDDNRDAVQAPAVLLELEGHEVTTADNGRDALPLMKERRPEVAIIDVGMREKPARIRARSRRGKRRAASVDRRGGGT